MKVMKGTRVKDAVLMVLLIIAPVTFLGISAGLEPTSRSSNTCLSMALSMLGGLAFALLWVYFYTSCDRKIANITITAILGSAVFGYFAREPRTFSLDRNNLMIMLMIGTIWSKSVIKQIDFERKS